MLALVRFRLRISGREQGHLGSRSRGWGRDGDATVRGVTDPTSLPSFPPPEDEHPLRGRVLDALLDEGYQPSIDEDGDVAVRVQEQLLFVRCLDTVPPMMRVFGQWLLDDSVSGDELTRLRAANAVTGALNLVKATVHGDRLAIAVDLVVGDGVQLRPLLAATLDAVLGSVRTWHATVTQLLADPEGDDLGVIAFEDDVDGMELDGEGLDDDLGGGEFGGGNGAGHPSS